MKAALTESVPSEGFSMITSAGLSSTYVSLPVPPMSVSLPLPPSRESVPSPPVRILSAVLPVRVLLRALPVPLMAAVPVRVRFSRSAARV